jgi:hypothetical protein
MNAIEEQAGHGEDMSRRIATLTLLGVVVALAAVFAAFLLPSPWSAITAVAACVVAGGCVGASVSVARNRPGNTAP